MNAFGVVIPPDEGDANHPSASVADLAGEVYDLLVGAAADLEPALWSGDNAEVCGIVQRVRHRLRREAGRIHRAHSGEVQPSNAPQAPHTPASAPNTPPRGLADAGDDSEALRAALAEALYADNAARFAVEPHPPVWGDLMADVQVAWLQDADALLPLLVAYGDQRAAEALREAAAARLRVTDSSSQNESSMRRAMTTHCAVCGVAAGERCVIIGTERPAIWPHSRRAYAARSADEIGRQA